jgi:hypothetical protein
MAASKLAKRESELTEALDEVRETKRSMVLLSIRGAAGAVLSVLAFVAFFTWPAPWPGYAILAAVALAVFAIITVFELITVISLHGMSRDAAHHAERKLARAQRDS